VKQASPSDCNVLAARRSTASVAALSQFVAACRKECRNRRRVPTHGAGGGEIGHNDDTLPDALKHEAQKLATRDKESL